MTLLFVNRLTVIDSTLLSPARGLVGESWQVDVELDGELDYQGMVLDFGEIKRSVKKAIDEQYDHKLLVPVDYPGLTQTAYPNGLHLKFLTEDGRTIEHRSPHNAVRQIPGDRIDAESLAQVISDQLLPLMPDNVNALRVRLWAEQLEGSYYHYSHGLKHHAGNCQRIAHGHRSRIEILRNGQRDLELERQWASGWTDIYIGTRGDLIGTSWRDEIEYCEFG